MTKLLLLAVLFSFSARADVEFEHKKNPCAKDHEEFCPNEKGKTKGNADCLAKHMSELAPECREMIEKVQAKVSAVKEEAKQKRAACSDDFFKLCQGIPFEEPMRTDCLKRHKSRLTEGCAKTLE